MSDGTSLTVIWHDRPHAHLSLNTEVVPWCKPLLDAGETIVATFQLQEEARSLGQNKFYWRDILRTISQQALIDGIGSDEEGWHYYFKRRLLGYKVVRVRPPGSKRPIYRRELRSTTDLKARRPRTVGEPDPSKYMPDYMEAIMAIAATEFGVSFPADLYQRWEPWR
jgi:hypothetical protein